MAVTVKLKNPPKIYSTETLSAVYNLHKFIYRYPLEWDPKKESFSSRGGAKNYVKYNLSLYGILGFLTPLAILLVVLDPGKFKLMNLLLGYVVVPMVVILTGIATTTQQNLQEIIAAFDNMKRVLNDIDQSVGKRALAVQKDHWKEVSGFVTLAFRSVCILTPIFIPVFLMMENFDLYYSLQYYLFELNPFNMTSSKVIHGLALVLRFLINLFSFGEGWRTFAVFNSVIFYWLEMQSKYFKLLEEKKGDFVRWYVKIQLCSRIWEECLNAWMWLMMGAMFAIIVGCNIVSIRYFGELPLLVYWFMPAVSVVDSGMLFFSFPFVVECHEATMGLLRQSKLDVVEEGRKIGSVREMRRNLKELRALMPISIKCGSSFVLKQDTKSTFYDTIVQRTVDGILI